MTTNKNAENDTRILREWEIWKFGNLSGTATPNGRDGLAFFGHLGGQKSELLTFDFPGDKWQYVHGLLQRHGKVSD